MNKLENKVAVITGGNSGIGLATAKLFAAHGARVAITGRNEETLAAAVNEIGRESVGFVSDAANLNEIAEVYESVWRSFGKINVLVVNAGVFLTAPFTDFTEDMFDETTNVNFKGVFFAVQKALPYLEEGASVILTSSTVSEKGMATSSAYAASKAAVRSLARGLSAELLDRNIRVNVLSPGPTDTPVFARGGATQEQIDGIKSFLISKTPANRLGTAEEIAEGFLYLASDASRFMVGADLLLDGGVRSL